jgi:hypothetical protein
MRLFCCLVVLAGCIASSSSSDMSSSAQCGTPPSKVLHENYCTTTVSGLCLLDTPLAMGI